MEKAGSEMGLFFIVNCKQYQKLVSPRAVESHLGQ